jgi:uroporphyrinogen decarboxylase
MFDKLHIDPVVTVAPQYIDPPIEPGYDMYGRRRENVSYGTGVYEACVYHPLAQYNSIKEIEEDYTWPTTDWFNYSSIPDQIKGKETYPIRGGGSEPFLTYTELRGMEQAHVDLIKNPALVEYCLDKLFNFCYDNTLRIYEHVPGGIDISYVAEDFGSQESLLFSPKIIREIFIPRMKHMIDLAHQAGVYVVFHSDGAIRPIIPDLIEIGLDVLSRGCPNGTPATRK